MEKLHAFYNTIKTKDMAAKQEQQQRDFEFLHGFVSVIFPSENSQDLTKDEINLAQDENDYFIANFDIEEKRPNNVYTEDYLPFHLYDEDWLVKYLETLLKNSNKYRSQAIKISKQTLHEFVAKDDVLAEARKAYEVDLTRAQIEFMMKSQKINGLLLSPKYNEKTKSYTMQPFYNPVLARLQNDPDKNFCQTVVTAMKKLNLSHESIETGLAKYSALWLDPLLKDAYYNRYMNDSFKKERFLQLEGWYDQAKRENFAADWIYLRKYEHYQNYKKVIEQSNIKFMDVLPQAVLAKMRKKCDEFDNQFQALTSMVQIDSDLTAEMSKSPEIVA